MSMVDCSDLILEEFGAILQIIDPVINKYTRLSNVHIQEMLDHALRPSGHRERPLLVKLSCEVVDGRFEQIVPAAVAVELLHFSTLVIDDIFDASPLRGNKDTVFVKYGINNAIIVSQLLSAMALEALGDVRNSQGLETEWLLRSIDVFKETQKQLYYGQYYDLLYEKQTDITEDQYYQMVSKTTGALIKCSLQIGAILAGGSEKDILCFAKYGDALGIAFQIRDDISEIIGNPEVIGKQIGGDIKQGKMRLPVIRALACSDERRRNVLIEMLEAKRFDVDRLTECMDIIIESGAVEYSKKVTLDLSMEAIAHLDHLADSPAKDGLVAFAEVVGSVW